VRKAIPLRLEGTFIVLNALIVASVQRDQGRRAVIRSRMDQ
jgi:hypothetical protein